MQSKLCQICVKSKVLAKSLPPRPVLQSASMDHLTKTRDMLARQIADLEELYKLHPTPEMRKGLDEARRELEKLDKKIAEKKV